MPLHHRSACAGDDSNERAIRIPIIGAPLAVPFPIRVGLAPTRVDIGDREVIGVADDLANAAIFLDGPRGREAALAQRFSPNG
jgi:hypothetical protein